jgi:hypothetical protein
MHAPISLQLQLTIGIGLSRIKTLLFVLLRSHNNNSSQQLNNITMNATTDSSMSSFQRTAKLVAAGSALGVVCFLAASSSQQQQQQQQEQHLNLSPNLHGTKPPSVHDITEMEHRRNLGKKGRIVGGQESKKGQFPFMVSLRNGDKDWSWATCGGSLISPSIVLTAAHCVGSIGKLVCF